MERTESTENHGNPDLGCSYHVHDYDTVIGQSIGILQSMRIQQAAGLNGNRYATFHQLARNKRKSCMKMIAYMM